MNRNPVRIVLPCHRVVGANGSLTGYGGGLERKELLLQLEGAIDNTLLSGDVSLHVRFWSPIMRAMKADDDLVFRALADPTRRHLLDRLYERDGRALPELESDLETTRFGVMKHLRVLEEAGLVVTRREGRQKLHYLNPVPIRLIHDRWIDKYRERQVSALADLKSELEDT